MIEAKHVEEGARRFQDFLKVQRPSCQQAEQFKHEVLARIGEGEDPTIAIQAVKATHDGSGFSEAIQRLKLSLGLTREAQRAFWAVLQHDPPGPLSTPEEVLDHAAYTGLIIGLSAAQLAREDGEA